MGVHKEEEGRFALPVRSLLYFTQSRREMHEGWERR